MRASTCQFASTVRPAATYGCSTGTRTTSTSTVAIFMTAPLSRRVRRRLPRARRIVGMKEQRPPQAQRRHFRREHVVTARFHAALDPRDEIVQALLRGLAAARAVPRPAHRAL